MSGKIVMVALTKQGLVKIVDDKSMARPLKYGHGSPSSTSETTDPDNGYRIAVTELSHCDFFSLFWSSDS